MQEPSAWHVPNFQAPRRKAGIRHKPHSCTNCLGTVSHSHQLRVVRTLNPSSQKPGKVQPYKQDFQRTAVRSAVLTLFYTLSF